ncbi:MAG: hypothetical protein H0X45_02670 [Planctomycetes bacterium]|nr:hypothetical protein [Planctomycetota bacterium]
MKKPERHLESQLGDLRVVNVMGRQYDLHTEVSIPSGSAMEEAVHDHVERYAKWKRIAAECRRAVETARDELTEWTGLRFMQFWEDCEKRERAEMQSSLHDEAEMAKDPFRAEARAKQRVKNGLTAMRWNRNFTDALIQSYVNNDKKITDLRTTLRDAKHALEISEAITDTLDHRMRCLSHLCAMHRDAGAK